MIAGSDSGGGAGIQADIKTINNLGGYATTAITALTAQNSQTVTEILPIHPEFIAKQIGTVCSDIKIDAVKIGMVYDLPALEAIFSTLEELIPNTPIILDPVMVSSSGVKLSKVTQKFLNFIKSDALHKCFLITPNIIEAEIICNMKIITLDDMVVACQIMKRQGAQAILLKGGHMGNDIVHDVLLSDKLLKIFESPRIPSKDNHGSGCALASAIATGIANKMELEEAIKQARTYVYNAMENAIIPGVGVGTLNHLH